MVSVSEFSRGRSVDVVDSQGVSAELLWPRFEEFSGKNNRYDVFTNNCEHLSSFLETGERHSPQVVGAVAGLVGGYVIGKGLELESPVAVTAIAIVGAIVGLNMATPKPGQPPVKA
jgi:hypothetical protein